jgi:outer membrane protein assembly factor BamB
MKRALLLPLCLALAAADWPQWRGPDRTDVSRETGLLKAWPKGGPKLLWTHDEAGAGYAGFSVVGERLYSMGAWKGKEHVFALDVKSGKRLWSAEVGPRFDNPWGGGPRSTPTVASGLVFALGAQGNLVCVKADSGEVVWKKALVDDLDGAQPNMNWGYSESPLLDGNRVIVTPGGPGGTLAALDKKTGKVLWRSKDWTDEANYSSAVVATFGGVRQYVQMTGESVAGVRAKDGKLLWRYARAQRIVVPTPIVFDNLVYVTSGYGAGCQLLEVSASGGKFDCEERYSNRNLVNNHGGVVRVGPRAFGYCDRNGWVCQKLEDGSLVWRETRALGKGSLTCADGLLYCVTEEDGTVALVEAIPKRWREKGRFTIPRRTKLPRPRNARNNVWVHPVVANGRLYLRDQELIFCYDVKASRP